MGDYRSRGKRSGGGGGGGYRDAFGAGFKDGPSSGPSSNQRRVPAFVERRERAAVNDERISVAPLAPGGEARVGWLYNMVATTVQEPSSKKAVQAVDLFFIPDDAETGGMDFVATIIARPYMLVAVQPGFKAEVESALLRDFRDAVAHIAPVRMEDTQQPNHLALDDKRLFLKLETRTTYELRDVKDRLLEVIARNEDRRRRAAAVDTSFLRRENGDESFGGVVQDGLDYIEDIREYDVAPVNRFAIDKKVNVGYCVF